MLQTTKPPASGHQIPWNKGRRLFTLKWFRGFTWCPFRTNVIT